MHSRVHIQKRRTDDPIWLLPDLLPYLAARLGAQPSARADMYPPSWYLSFAMLNLDRLLWKIPVLHHGAQALLGTRFVPEGAQLVLLFSGLANAGTGHGRGIFRCLFF